MTYFVSDNERAVLHAVMDQAERDLKSAHAEICRLQNLDPDKNEWPNWSPQANSLRWFAAIREKFPAPPDHGRLVFSHGSGPDNALPLCPRCRKNPIDPVLLGREGEGHVCGSCWTKDRHDAEG